MFTHLKIATGFGYGVQGPLFFFARRSFAAYAKA
jgi:hypothetical protein